VLLRPGLRSDTPRAKVRNRSRGRDGDGDNSVSPELVLK
jgi:hypothetical protein